MRNTYIILLAILTAGLFLAGGMLFLRELQLERSRAEAAAWTAKIVNDVRDAYEVSSSEKQRARVARLAQNLESQIQEQVDKVNEARLLMHDLQKKYSIVDRTPLFHSGEPGAGAQDISQTEEARSKLIEYHAAKRRYEEQFMILSSIRDLAARRKVDITADKTPGDILEPATPPVP